MQDFPCAVWGQGICFPNKLALHKTCNPFAATELMEGRRKKEEEMNK